MSYDEKAPRRRDKILRVFFIMLGVLFVAFMIEAMREDLRPKLTAAQIAEGRGCLDGKGSIPDMEDKVKAQFADAQGFHVVDKVELMRSDVDDPAIVPKDASFALMRVAGKNKFGGMSFFSASGLLNIKDCTVKMFELKEE